MLALDLRRYIGKRTFHNPCKTFQMAHRSVLPDKVTSKVMTGPWRRHQLEKGNDGKKIKGKKHPVEGVHVSLDLGRCSKLLIPCYQYIQVQYQMHAIAPKWADGVSVPASGGLQTEFGALIYIFFTRQSLSGGFGRIGFFTYNLVNYQLDYLRLPNLWSTYLGYGVRSIRESYTISHFYILYNIEAALGEALA